MLLFHAVLVWGLMSGLAQKIVTQVTEPFKVEEVSEPPPPDENEPPPPPPPTQEPPPYVPPPDFTVDAPAAQSERAITESTTKVTPKGPTVPVRIDPRRPPSQPDYPPSAKRLEQEGVVGLLLYVGADGRVEQVQVEKSSGFPALDAAAAAEARKWRFLPAQNEGQPVAAWHRISVRFRLEDAR
ncbi:MAG: TonB family protein [Parvularculaceae bacterium]|nr:TonB family protein [Parvularculaceae bacterium]